MTMTIDDDDDDVIIITADDDDDDDDDDDMMGMTLSSIHPSLQRMTTDTDFEAPGRALSPLVRVRGKF